MRNEETGGTPVINRCASLDRTTADRPLPRPAQRVPQHARLIRAEPGSTEPLPLELVRRDVAGDRPGVPLMLRVRVLDAHTGTSVGGAVLEIRHREATGDGEVRGAQVTGAEGYAEFRTVHPGREAGAPVAIHAEVHVGGYLAGGRSVTYAGPLFVPEQIAGQIDGQVAARAEDPSPDTGGVLHVVPRDRFDLKAGLLGTITVAIGE
ncbi:hypothetical protein KZ829_17120 [Actinoplanes hulinensis]|uniref:Uncharacterized protein n=1 Tax=Actinoplanes hulinensis TaxID=1144547 RepID=A0ABS7B3M6_9ACTN|nr:hypothetical protein [Actinoplanes hulinensis]MBW6435462.1 hypothetical protein [Actinoplanes hulinensis]